MWRWMLTVMFLSMVSAAQAVAAEARGVDVVPVLQAGQGQARFCPQDARLTDPTGTMISLPGIYARLEKCPARFKLLLTDACRDPHYVPADVQVALINTNSGEEGM